MRHYCTYFDGNYAARGMAMLHSLALHDPGCRVLVWALDGKAFDALEHCRPSCVEQIELRETVGVENIWRLTPGIVLHALKAYGEVAYIDADLYWFSSPQPMYDEAGNAPAAIIPHRFPPDRQHRARDVGEYNVGWVWFNGEGGEEIARVWGWQCRNWKPYGRWQRFMDQPFLDLWPHYGAHVIQHLGANLAPYNQKQYSERRAPVIFYHFHEWKMLDATHCTRGGYPLRDWVVRECYEPYEAEIAFWTKELGL